VPPGLENDWSARGYYGTISHDSKAVYQRYLGWYDGNPATLNPLPRVEQAKKYLEYMGGSAAVIARAHDDFKAGRYRWVAQIMDQVVFADPSNQEARGLAADAFEQLGYLAESATWRNAYLLGAQELRSGVRGGARSVPGVSAEMLHAMPIALVFDYLGTRVDGPRAGTANIVINWRFTDTRESVASTLEHGALTSVTGKTAPNALTTVTTTRTVFESVILGQRTLADVIEHRDITTTGDAKTVSDLFTLLVDFESGFPVVEPGRYRERVSLAGLNFTALQDIRCGSNEWAKAAAASHNATAASAWVMAVRVLAPRPRLCSCTRSFAWLVPKYVKPAVLSEDIGVDRPGPS
jgi:alkyl sulfatase BDS1-like metallo-beta-lactamase superfamily hydrolase